MSKLSRYFYLLSEVSKYSDTDANNGPQKKTGYIVNCGRKLQINFTYEEAPPELFNFKSGKTLSWLQDTMHRNWKPLAS